MQIPWSNRFISCIYCIQVCGDIKNLILKNLNLAPSKTSSVQSWDKMHQKSPSNEAFCTSVVGTLAFTTRSLAALLESMIWFLKFFPLSLVHIFYNFLSLTSLFADSDSIYFPDWAIQMPSITNHIVFSI